MRKPAIPFPLLCQAFGLPAPAPEFRFAPPRRWRFDWSWAPDTAAVALEVEGGAWTGGRHTRGAGFLKDMEKYNEAQVRGWTVLRCTPGQIQDGSIFPLLARALGTTIPSSAPGWSAVVPAASSSTKRTRRVRAVAAGRKVRAGDQR